jgi:hypothetical protein
MADAQISTRFGSLQIDAGGWRLTCQAQGGFGLPSSPGLPSARPQWGIVNKGLLTLHGWNAGTDVAWQGTFCPGSRAFSLQRDEMIKGVGACKLITIEGFIVGHPDHNLPARLDFAMAKDSGMMLWRAQVKNDGPHDLELETITMLSAKAGVGGTVAKISTGRVEGDMHKAVEVALWAWTSLILAMPFALRIFSLTLRLAVLSASFAGASFLCKRLQSGLSLDHDPVWGSVLVNGWQSFSYAGYLSLQGCYGMFGALRRVLSLSGLWSMQPSPQTGAAFSGAFHEVRPPASTHARALEEVCSNVHRLTTQGSHGWGRGGRCRRAGGWAARAASRHG